MNSICRRRGAGAGRIAPPGAATNPPNSLTALDAAGRVRGGPDGAGLGGGRWQQRDDGHRGQRQGRSDRSHGENR